MLSFSFSLFILYLIKVSSKSKITVNIYGLSKFLSKKGTLIGRYKGEEFSSKSRYVTSFISFISELFNPNTLKQ